MPEKTIDETKETKEKRKNYRLASSVLALMLKIDFSDQYDIVDNKIGKIGLSGDEVPAQFYTKLQTYLDCKCSKSYTVPVDSIALGLILDGLKLNDLTKGHNLVVDAIKAEKVKGYSIKTGSKGGVIKL